MWVLVPLVVLLGGAGSHAFVTGGCLYFSETRRTHVLQQLPVCPLKAPTAGQLRNGASSLRCCIGSANQKEDDHGRGRGSESPEPRATAWYSSLVPRTVACALALVTAGLPSTFVDQGFPSQPGGVFLSRSFVPSASAAPVARLEETSNAEQIAGGLSPVNTVRGVWRIRETRTDGSTLPQEPGKLSKGICRGRLSFKGFVGSGKGTVDYKMCGDREGKGRWLTKPKNIINRRITLSARWKVTFRDGTSLLYRGDVFREEGEELPLRVAIGGGAGPGSVGFERPNAHIRGDVYEPVTLPQGTLTEKKIGEFEADLIELPTDDDRL